MSRFQVKSLKLKSNILSVLVFISNCENNVKSKATVNTESTLFVTES